MKNYKIINSKANSYASTVVKYEVSVPEGFSFLLAF